MSRAAYNEIEPFAAEWMRQLEREGHIASGIVDERSIVELQPRDLEDYAQAHFFAGIGGWSYALRLAGWPDGVAVWTGSCPCQPFSAAGKRRGFSDERHLWPEWFRLIRECRPPVVFGEQVASPDGLAWLDAVSADLEGAGYAVGAADLCASGVGAPHIRQRLYFVAIAERLEGRLHLPRRKARPADAEAIRGSEAGDLANAERGRSGTGRPGIEDRRPTLESDRHSATRDVGDSASSGRSRQRIEPTHVQSGQAGPWADCEWIPCRDGKARPVEPGPQQMADGFSEMLGRLRPDAIKEIETEIRDAALSEADARKALRDMWCDLASRAIQRSPGRFQSVYEAPVLLAVLRQLAREGWNLINHLPSACWETPEAGLRELRQAASPAPCPSSRRDSVEQRTNQSADALSVVSQAIARAALDVITHPLANDVPGRVGRLRGYGNAIVPEVAATFIQAVMPIVFAEAA